MIDNHASQTVRIGNFEVSPTSPPMIVAEVSANHLGQFERAKAHLEAAAQAGADAVKLQTYTADSITIDYDGPGFTIDGGLWNGRRLYGLYEEAYTPWEWHKPLIEYGNELGVEVFSSPFDFAAVDFLDELEVPALKIASFELVDIPLIERAAATGRPLIMSTGMAGLGEIETAVTAARSAGDGGLMLLHCISGYPTPIGESNLRTLQNLANSFDCPVGLSDHSPGTAVAVAAVALGARLVEKHFTLSRADGGPDAAFSLEPDELANLATDCRDAWAALGTVSYDLKASETGNAQLRRSLYVVEDLQAGDSLNEANCRSIRPGFGLSPKHYDIVLGRHVRRDVARGTPLAWDMIE